METDIEKKLELPRTEEQDLRMFFIIGKRVVPPPIEERVIAPLGYKLEEALGKAKIKYPGFNLFYNGQNMTVRELLEQLRTNGSISPSTEQGEAREEEPLPPEKLRFEQFRNCLLLVVNEYVPEKDRDTLKDIIKQLKNEPKGKIEKTA